MSGIFRQQEMCLDPSRPGGKRPRPLRGCRERVGKGRVLQKVVAIAGAAFLPLTLSLRARQKRGSNVAVPDLTAEDLTRTMAASEIANLVTSATNPLVLYRLP